MNLLRNFYRLAAPFWLTRQSWKAWLALGSAIACSLLFVQVVVLVARWQKAFFDALSNFGAKEIPQLLLEYLIPASRPPTMRLLAILLPSPTKQSFWPASVPRRSRMVIRSASTWQGWA